jgi:monofunctional biosynthetic peptidoglycan transglycosylase
VAKNLFLWPGRSFVRKALELPLALWIDAVLPKQRILELYLNVAELGPSGQFGAEAGSAYAFGHSAANLSPREAALLAAILPNPVKRSARNPGPGVRRLMGTYMVRAQASVLQRCWGENR